MFLFLLIFLGLCKLDLPYQHQFWGTYKFKRRLQHWQEKFAVRTVLPLVYLHLEKDLVYCKTTIILFFQFVCVLFVLLHNSSTLKSTEFNISVQRERWYFSYYKKKIRLSKNTQFDFKSQNNMPVIKISVEIQLYLSIALCRVF